MSALPTTACYMLDYYDPDLGREVRGILAYSAAEVAAFQTKCLRLGVLPRVKPYESMVRQ